MIPADVSHTSATVSFHRQRFPEINNTETHWATDGEQAPQDRTGPDEPIRVGAVATK
jgi:hypothetical protein